MKIQNRIYKHSNTNSLLRVLLVFEGIPSHDDQLMRRYLYVGISRATSHLAATMRSDDDNSIVKYFETENATWR